MQVVARVVVAEHQRMAQVEVEQRLRGLVRCEALLLATASSDVLRRVDQPLDVVAVVVGVARIGSVSDSGRSSITFGSARQSEEEVLEDVGLLAPV